MNNHDDFELLYLIRCGSDVAKECLIEKYMPCITNWVKQHLKGSKGSEKEDMMQIALISLWDAVIAYRDDRNATFKTYVQRVINNALYDEVVKNNRRIEYKNVLRLDSYINDEDDRKVESVVEDYREEIHPIKALMVKERSENYHYHATSKGTKLEVQVLKYKEDGYSTSEIAKLMGISKKTVYNAIYRLRKKSRLTEINKYDKL